jgi:hypothetical protein
MNTVPGRPAQPVALETASMRADFQARLEELQEAAEAWGVRPDHPEGRFVSTMIGTQAGFAELALSLAEVLHNVVKEARATAEEELARQRVVTERTRQTLTRASGVIENLDKGARSAIERIEVEKTEILTQLVKDILPDMTRGVREALVIRERRYNHDRDWGRALGIGGMMIGLVFAGYIWGTWGGWGLSSRVERIGAAIERCELTSHWADDKGNRLCEIKDFSAL